MDGMDGMDGIDWKILDENGLLLEEVNCQYDALDIAVMFYNAIVIEIDFDKEEARILKRKE